MKRKKGAKGSFKKVKKNDFLFTSEPNSSSFSIDGENNVGQTGEGQGKGKFELEVEQPTTINNKITKASNRDPDNASSKVAMKAGHNRVKVKLKSSKLLEPHKRSSDLHMSTVSITSDTDRSNSQFVTEINEMTFGKIDATCSVGQTLKTGKLVPENPARKFGSIKIKSSRTSGLSDFLLKQMDFKVPHNDTCHNTNDLSAALTVIRKVMKMDAAGPFNAPVNPVALGIPDYFDIIDNPMDFGSICQDLELGTKYKNSLDVYNDVQFIWDNCYKYNNKGDYIMELMKRVKKNFMKYWTAAGLLTEISVGTQDVLRLHKGKSTSKRKSKHKRRRHGIDGHKSNCLCAVCVVRRRRKEREERSASLESQMIISHTGLSNEPKLEVSSAENPCSKGTVSSFDRSPETDADAEMAEEAGKIEPPTSALEEPERFGTSTTNWEAERDPADAADNEAIGNSPHDNGAKDDSSDQQFYGREWHYSNSSKHGDKKDEDDNEIQHRELNPREQEMKLLENSSQQENHSVLWLCGRLFPGNQNSVWNGPHSFNRRRAFNKQNNNNNNPMRSALATAGHSI